MEGKGEKGDRRVREGEWKKGEGRRRGAVSGKEGRGRDGYPPNENPDYTALVVEVSAPASLL